MLRENNSSKTKVCIAVTLPTWGGAQQYVFDLANSFLKTYNLFIAAGQGENTKLLNDLATQQVPFHQFRFLVREISPIKDFFCIFEIWWFFRKNKFDIVHLNSSKVGVIGAIAAKLAGVKKVIYTAHGFVFNEKINFVTKGIYIFLELTSFLFTDCIITVSEFDSNSLKKLIFVNKNKIRVIYNGVNEKDLKFKTEKEARHFFFDRINKVENSNQKIIYTIANLFENKGIDNLIEAVSKIVSRDQNLIFIVAGDGPCKYDLKKLVEDKNLKNYFYFIGFLKNPEQYLKAAHLYISSSRKEGLPYSLIHALAAQVPIVTTDAGGCSEIVGNNISGLIVPVDEPNELAINVIKIINNKVLYDSLRDGALVSLRKFSIEKMIENTKKVYEETK